MINYSDVVALVRLQVQRATTTHAALSGATLPASIGGRVLAPALLDADAGTLERPCVVVDVMGGGANYGEGVQRLPAHLYAYSDASQGEASAIYDALYQELNGTRLRDPDGVLGMAGYAYETDRPHTGHNDAMKSFYTRGTWMIHVAG